MAKKQVNPPSIYWHDYETFGINPKNDRPSQFAGIRTDFDLNIIGEPLMVYAKPANDFLPEPDACLVTGITPQQTLQNGLIESDFIGKILKEFSQPNTCVAGYNSIRFDDEFTRYTLYRNLYPAYDREWQYGNSRWDIIDLVRVTHALRPDGINWPTHDNGLPSYRLEDITAANNLSHDAAHDALSDVIATIAVAKLIKEKQPALYNYYFSHRQKRNTAKLLDAVNKKPVLHTSSMFSSEYYCTALVVPLIQHPTNSNAVVCYDLRYDPTALLSLSTQNDIKKIRQQLYTKTEDLAEGQQRLAIKSIHLNKCPVIVPAKIDTFAEERLSIDKAASYKHLEMLRQSPTLEHTLLAVFSENDFVDSTDPDQSLYSGPFFNDRDKSLMKSVHKTDVTLLGEKSFDFTDTRLEEMLFRFRARNYFSTLTDNEKKRWGDYRHDRLSNKNHTWMTVDKFDQRITVLREELKENAQNKSAEKLISHNQIIDQLVDYKNIILEDLK